jgi:predicted DNA-binding protein (MmcQ/YjbR family)
MTREEFDTLCARQPGAVLSGPGELDAWKIGGKMFTCFGHTDERATNTEKVAVRVQDIETAEMLINAGVAAKPPYFRGAWVQLDLGALSTDDATHRIQVSYDTIRASLTKKAQAALPPRETV